MKTVVIGAAGGLGRNVLNRAAFVGHQVTAFVRRTSPDGLPSGVAVATGDAARHSDLVAGTKGPDVLFFCVNPRFSRWSEDFPPLLEAAIQASRQTGARLVFPANVWVYGPGSPGDLIDEERPPQPSSKHGRLRTLMEQRIRESGCRYCIIRLPEFYGPHVVSLTARVFVAALKRRPVLWPGPLGVDVEFVYMPDAAVAMVDAGTAEGSDSDAFHIPGVRTTVGRFINSVASIAETGTPRVFAVPTPALKLAGLVSKTLSAVADISHLWTHPILLDGSRYVARFGAVPQTAMSTAIGESVSWYRNNPDITLQA